MEKFESCCGVAEVEFKTTCSFLVEDAVFVTFHQECTHCAPGDCVDTVCIAVEVEFKDNLWVCDTAVWTNACCCFVFRTVNNYFASFVWTCEKFKVVSCFCTSHGTTIPATVSCALCEPFFDKYLWVHFSDVWCAAEFEVVSWQDIVVIENFHGICCTDFSHIVLFRVLCCHFTVVFNTCFVDDGDIVNVVKVVFDTLVFTYNSFDFLVTEYTADTTTASLFETNYATVWIVECKVEHGDVAVFCCRTCTNNSNVFAVVFVVSIHSCKFFAHKVSVHMFKRCFFYRNSTFVTVDNNDYIFFCLTFKFDSIKAGELEVWAKEATNVGVDWNICHW